MCPDALIDEKFDAHVTPSHDTVWALEASTTGGCRIQENLANLLVSHPLAECYKVGAALTYNVLKWQVKGTFTAYLSAKCYKVSAEYAVPRPHIFTLDFIEFGT